MRRLTSTKKIRFAEEKKLTENIFPYDLPENWHWTTLEKVCELSKGEKISDEKFPYLDVKYLRGAKEKKLVEGGNFISKGTKAILVDGENSGEIFTVFEDGYLGSTLRKVKIFENVDANFFQYFISTKKNLYRQNKKGSAIPHLNKNLFYSTFFPLPPIDEQKKIVERIESLFSKLDSAKSIVQKILDGYELRRSAILHKAFTGELSKNFRAENNLSLDDWENLPLPCIFSIKSGTTLPIEEEKSTGKIPYVKVSDMNIKENSVQIITSSKFVDNCRQANIIPEGSVIFPKRGGAIFTNKKRYVGVEKIVADLNIMALIPNCNKIFSWYGYYWMLSVDLKEICNGSNIPQINHKDMMKLFLSLPPFAEQKEIVRVLDSLLDKEQRTQEIAEKILQEIDLLKKSVLARAFRGEL